MEWVLARERLGAELIGARESIAIRWRRSLREQGAMPWALDRCASELVLQAGAALADGAPGEAPWRRCGALLRIDTRDQAALAAELTLLWEAMAGTLGQVALTVEEHQQAREVLGQQVEAALRGAALALRAAFLDETPEDESLRFGGPTAVCFRSVEREEEPAFVAQPAERTGAERAA